MLYTDVAGLVISIRSGSLVLMLEMEGLSGSKWE
jgi:hypothetical protein